MGRNTSSHSILERFHGQWELEREITDVGKFLGIVNFAPTKGGLAYSEKGTMYFETGHKNAAWQNLFFESGSVKNEILVWKTTPDEQKTLLHRLTFGYLEGNLVAEHTHVCGDDRYTVNFEILTNSEIRISYRIKGPRKDYCADSVLQRFENI